MLKAIEQLLVLQDRDRKLRALRQEQKNAPLERKKLEEKLAATNQQLEAVKLRGREIEVERKRLENEAQAKRDQIAKYQVQKFQTRKNEEFRALSNEIERLEGDIRTIEDRELELMEATEKITPQIVEAEQAARDAKAMVQRQLEDLETKGKTLEAQIRQVESERAGSAVGVDEDLLDNYQRLFATKGNAVVAVEHEVCTGCHMKVTASTNARAKAGREIVHCEQCGRIVYVER